MHGVRRRIRSARSYQKPPAYRRMALRAGKVWLEYGALQFRECVGDDLNVKGIVTCPQRVKLKPAKQLFFTGLSSSRAHTATA
jgi:uncharacterized protein YbaA (DUF1428 family)